MGTWRVPVVTHAPPQEEIVMKIASSWSTESDTNEAVASLWAEVNAELGERPDWITFYPSVEHDATVAAAALSSHSGDTPLHGATSCLGVMTGAGFHTDDGVGMGMLAISDPAGSYGVAAAPIGGDPTAAAQQALLDAMTDAGRVGEPPSLVWLAAVPGAEEALLSGIHAVIGAKVPVAGGSAADNTIEGKWRQFSTTGAHQDAVVISVLYPSRPLHHSFHSGYLPTETRGTVTRAEGRRVFEIDGEAAGSIYARWSEGAIDEFTTDGGSILAASTMWPLGRSTTSEDSDYVLAHPATLHPDQSIELFADVEEGDELILMHGSEQSLVSRAGRVATAALAGGGITSDDCAGALVVYCAGCMLAIQNTMDAVAEEMTRALGGRPFLGMFTFGEQGCFVGGDNYHGNLMISVVAFEADAS